MYEYGFLTEDTERRFETWEFDRLSYFQADSLREALAQLGAMGWELAAFDHKRYIMKRAI